MAKTRYFLIDALLSYAPNEEAKKKTVDFYDALVRSMATDEAIQKILITELYNGVTEGHWPWT